MKNLPNKLFVTRDETSPIELFRAETSADPLADANHKVVAGEYALIRYVDILPPIVKVKPSARKKEA